LQTAGKSGSLVGVEVAVRYLSRYLRSAIHATVVAAGSGLHGDCAAVASRESMAEMNVEKRGLNRSGSPSKIQRLPILLPITMLFVVTVVFHCTCIDLVISGLFYRGPQPGWFWASREPWITLYRWGVYPGLLMGIGGFVVAAGGLIFRRLRRWQKEGLFLALLLLVGPGLLVNVCFKDCWGRPRPCETAVFGGVRPFVPPGVPGPTEGRSFPSGHASMGFLLMGPAFFLYRRNRLVAFWFLLLGITAGTSIGLARIVQGGHYASDVLWSAGMVYMSGWLLDWMLHRPAKTRAAQSVPTCSPPAPTTRQSEEQETAGAGTHSEPVAQFAAQPCSEALQQAA